MSVKLQLDTNRFHILCSSNISLSVPVPVSPPDRAEPRKRVLQGLNGGRASVKRIHRVYKRGLDRRGVVREDGLSRQKPEKNPDSESEFAGKSRTKKDFDGGYVNGLVGEVHTRCSTKCVTEGGPVTVYKHNVDMIGGGALDHIPGLEKNCTGDGGGMVKIRIPGSVREVQGKHSTKWVANGRAGKSVALEHGLSKLNLGAEDDDRVVKKSDIGSVYKGVNGNGVVAKGKARHSTKWVANGSVEKSVALEDGLSKQNLGTEDDSRVVNRSGIGLEYKGVNVNGVVAKGKARYSMKWAAYGGLIPAILQALDSINDLDEALRPWEKTLNNKERSIILKEQTSWERALEIFAWFKKKGCYELNVIHYNIVLKILGRARKWSHVETLWDEMMAGGVVPINSTYGTLIDVYGKGGRKEEALLWVERMSKQGIEPDEVTIGNVVQLYKNLKEFQKAEEFYKKWSSGKFVKEGKTSIVKVKSSFQSNAHTSSHLYNTLIDTYGKAGKLEEASNTFAQMLREGVAPTTVTFNTMIHICGNHGNLDEVTSLMQKMEKFCCPPNTRTYNILISLHAKHDNINMAISYFRKMKEASLEPDLVSYRTLLYACSIRQMVGEAEDLVAEMDDRGLQVDEFTQSALTRMYIEAGMLEQSWLWFRRFHLAGNMSSECYSANIDAYGERGHILEAEKVFACCQEGRRLSVLVYNVMVKAYGISKKFEKACQLFDSMGNQGVTPDKSSYRSLMQFLVSADMPQMATFYLRKMQEAGLVSDCVPYCAVISSFVKLGHLDMVGELYKEMIKHNVQPDVMLYGVLINAYADAGSVKEAFGYLRAMQSAGLAGNAIIYNSLIKLFTKVGYLNEAQETYKSLMSTNIGPDIYCSNCMINLYSKRFLVKEAKEVFEYLKKKGDATEFSYAMMLYMYREMGRFEEAIKIAHEMRQLGCLKDLLSYNSVLGLYALDGRFKDAVETFKEMMEASVLPDAQTLKSLGVVLVKSGVPKQAVGKLEIAWKRDAQSGLQAWMSTLYSVVLEEYDDD